MLKSDIVEVDGVFVGAAILQPNRTDRAFFATHERVRSLHGQILPSPGAVRVLAARQLRHLDSVNPVHPEPGPDSYSCV